MSAVPGRLRGGGLRTWVWAAAVTALFAGCKTMQPHIVTKVIIQHDNVAAEASAEWK